MAHLRATTWQQIYDLVGDTPYGTHVKLGHNTWAMWNMYGNEQGKVSVKLHKTWIAVLTDETITLDSGGYRSKTTKECINQLLADYGYRVFQTLHRWYVRDLVTGEDQHFHDGMTLKRHWPAGANTVVHDCGGAEQCYCGADPDADTPEAWQLCDPLDATDIWMAE